MFFELQAVPEIVTKAREQLEDARDQLLRESKPSRGSP